MMEELSLNLLDIVQNSVAAAATVIEIGVVFEGETMTIEVSDNGTGMSRERMRQVNDPFVTTRTTRKLGFGIPFFREAAELTGGSLTLRSEEGRGTRVTAVFFYRHIDMQPLGDLAGTITSLILLNPELEFILKYQTGRGTFHFSTQEVRAQLGEGGKLNHPDVITFLTEYLSEQIESLNGGEQE